MGRMGKGWIRYRGYRWAGRYRATHTCFWVRGTHGPEVILPEGLFCPGGAQCLLVLGLRHGGDGSFSASLPQGLRLLWLCMRRKTAVWMRLNLPPITGLKRRCLCLHVRGVAWQLRDRKEETKPVSDVKARESSVRDIQLFLEIWQVQNKPRGNTCHLFRQL